MKSRRILTVLLIFSLTITMFTLTGCGSKKSGTNNSQGAQKNAGGQQFSAENIKKMLDDNLSTLVQDGTITAEQEDKVINAISDNMKKRMASITGFPRNGQRNGGERPSGSPGGNRQWRQDGNNNSGTNNDAKGNGGTDGSNNSAGRQRGAMYSTELKSLVKDGTITQKQADAIEEALANGFGGMFRENRENGNDNGNNGTNNSKLNTSQSIDDKAGSSANSSQ